MRTKDLNAILISLGAVAQVPLPASSETLDALEKKCTEQVIVVNSEARKIGYRPNDYCLGFLDATFGIMARSKLICTNDNLDERRSDSTFLITVLQTVGNDPSIKDKDKIDGIMDVFQRAFPCKK